MPRQLIEALVALVGGGRGKVVNFFRSPCPKAAKVDFALHWTIAIMCGASKETIVHLINCFSRPNERTVRSQLLQEVELLAHGLRVHRTKAGNTDAIDL